MRGFLEFIRGRGVVGFATGFILGSAVSRLVTSFVNDIINPVLGVALGFTRDLKTSYFRFGPVKIAWGDFAVNLIDFLILAGVVYVLFKLLRLEKIDLKKDKK